LPSLWYGVAGMTEVCNTAGLALNFGPGSRYNFNVRQVGYCFTSGLIGAAIGEFCGGPICDFVAKRSLDRGDVWKPEKLLHVCWSGLFAIVVSLQSPLRFIDHSAQVIIVRTVGVWPRAELPHRVGSYLEWLITTHIWARSPRHLFAYISN
jgi:hypothetical protein